MRRLKFARRPAARDDASGDPWPKPRILAFQRTRKRRRQAQASTAPPSVLQVLRVIARQRAEIRRHAAAAAIGGAPPDAPALCQLYAHARATFSVRETISRRLTRRSPRPARGTRSHSGVPPNARHAAQLLTERRCPAAYLPTGPGRLGRRRRSDGPRGAPTT